MAEQEVKEFVKKRYGEIAETGTTCCGPSCTCGPSALDTALQLGYSKEELESIPETSNLGLGCGNPTALAGLNKGETVLDLGSGGGIDAFLAAQKVGSKGKVIGVDMTEKMIEKAQNTAIEKRYENVEFRQGEIENLPVEDNTIDVIVSNCVINLSPDKEKVYREAYRVLKPKGRILISDIVTEEELPDEVKKSFDAWAGCVAGALERNEYLDIIKKSGFKNVKIVSESTFDFEVSPELKGKITSLQVEAKKS
jgi:ubiquinone/menaquinone biosynthesis C-methylase UbiE